MKKNFLVSAVLVAFITFLSSCASTPSVSEYQELIPIDEIPEESRLVAGEEPFAVLYTDWSKRDSIQQVHSGIMIEDAGNWDETYFGKSQDGKRLLYKIIGKIDINNGNMSIETMVADANRICKEKGIPGFAIRGGIFFLVPYSEEDFAEKNFLLGIEVSDVYIYGDKTNTGARVFGILENFPADIAFPKLEDGDIIQKVGDMIVRNKADFLLAQKTLEEGSSVIISFMRGKIPLTTELKIPENMD